MINYYDVCVNAARMINNPRATKEELLKLAKRMFSYVGKTFDESSFNKAFTDFRKCETRAFRNVCS